MPQRAKKSLGQNYLVNESVARRIVEAAAPEPSDLIFEIGPGRGALTRHLAGSGGEIVSFELDSRHCRELAGEFSKEENVHIEEADIRNVDLDREAEERGRDKFKLIGNIPYMLTSTILIGIPGWDGLQVAVIMVQKEVAERILEEPGMRNCGVLTIFLRSYLSVEKVADVGAGSFSPRPKVDSTVLRFVRAGDHEGPEQMERYLDFLKAAFSRRRKKLRNSLLDMEAARKRELQQELEERTGIDFNRRAENLGLREWFTLFEAFSSYAGFDETG